MSRPVLLLFAATPDPAAAVAAALGADPAATLAAAIGDEVRLTVLTAGGVPSPVPGAAETLSLEDAPSGLADRILRATGATALRDQLSGSPVGRLINSLGPADSSRVFWRAVRVQRGWLDTVERTTIAIAVDLPATRAAVGLLRRHRVGRALFGLRAAIELLRTDGEAS